jgi:hypothetical protein
MDQTKTKDTETGKEFDDFVCSLKAGASKKNLS